MLAEAKAYNIDMATRITAKKSITLGEVLDLTDSKIQDRLGIRAWDLVNEDYTVTQQIGDWASNHYDAILVPSAREIGEKNLVIFRPEALK